MANGQPRGQRAHLSLVPSVPPGELPRLNLDAVAERYPELDVPALIERLRVAMERVANEEGWNE